jgi:hypothetical protein
MAAAATDFRSKILPPNEELQGLSYSAWQERWIQWALSANPFYGHFPHEPVFAHGRLTNTYTGESQLRDSSEYMNILANIEGQPDTSLQIYNDTPIIVNVMGAFYFIGDLYDGRTLNDSSACLDACRQDMNSTRDLFFEIQKSGETWQKCPSYYVESRFFNVEVAEGNPYIDKLETPLQPGPHQGFTINYCLILKNLDDGEYFIRFSAKGRKGYESKAFYQLIVKGASVTDPTKDDVIFPPMLINGKSAKLFSGIDPKKELKLI